MVHNNCNVPEGYSKNPSLGKWVSHQRTAYKNKTISQVRIDKLTGIGFEWDSINSLWGKNFLLLSRYKEVHKNCNVPAVYPENPSLGMWVGTQWRAYKNKTLSQERIDKLTGIGFEWRIR